VTARFFITIDTEEDDWGEYRTSGFSVENIGQIPRLQELFDRYGAVPTYLVTYPVVTSDSARAIFLDILARHRCEIGAHCHPWNSPPFDEEINARHSMLCTPLVDWTIYAGPNYRDAPLRTYQFNPDDIQSIAVNGSLLEVPATIGFLQSNYGLCRRLTQSRFLASRLHVTGILERTGLVNLRWLSPEMSTGKEMVRLARTCLARGSTHLNMTLHSTTLFPGKSPYVRTEEDLQTFLGRIEMLLQFAANEGLVFSALSKALDDI
jgi:hypothetical protein